MTASIKLLKDPFTLDNAQHLAVEKKQTVEQFVADNLTAYERGNDQPIAVLIDNELVEPLRWHKVDLAGDVVIAPIPEGLDPITQAIIVIATIAASVAISSALIKMPDDDGQIADAAPSYSVNAQGNAPRLGSVIPVRYGEFRVFPDWASIPYREYENNNEFLYQIFSVGWGEFDMSDLKIGQTPIANFDDVQYQLYKPGQAIGLFRSEVYSASEVSGQGVELFAPNDSDYSGYAGAYVTNAAGTKTDLIAVDVTLNGLYKSNKKGGLDAATVSFTFEYRAIKDDGTPVSSTWQQLTTQTYTEATVDVIRRTIKVAVPLGRYEVRAVRTNNSSDDYKLKDDLTWSGLRAYLQSDQTFDQTILAVKVRATAQLSAQSERKINAIFKRKLNTFDGTNWLAASLTRNPVWAFCDAIVASYGGNYARALLPAGAKLKQWADWCDTNKFYFDGQYEKATLLEKALAQMCGAFRAFPQQIGDQFDFVVDNGQPQSKYLFNADNTLKGKAPQVQFKTMDVWADDSVEVEYFDPVSWKPEHILCSVPGSSAKKPTKRKLFGITDRKQAHKIGMYWAGKQAYRNQVASFGVEMESRALNYLDGAIVVAPAYDNGFGGQVVAVDGQVLTLSQPVELSGASNYIFLRKKDGTTHTQLPVAVVANEPQKVQVTGTIPAWVYTGFEYERTLYAISTDNNKPVEMLVERVSPSGQYRGDVTAVINDPRVFQFDTQIDGGTLPTPAPVPPKPAANLAITGLSYKPGGTAIAPEIFVSWLPASGAKQYIIEWRPNGGAWEGRQTVIDPLAVLRVTPGLISVRVAAMGDEIGAWLVFDVDAGKVFGVPPTPTGLQLIGGAFTGNELKIEWTDSVEASEYYVEFCNQSDVNTVLYADRTDKNNYSLHVDTAVLNGLKREMRVKLYGVNGAGVRSVTPAEITVKNEQAAIPANIVTMMNVNSLFVRFDVPTETDFAGFHVFVEKGASTVVVTASSPRYTESEKFKYHIEIPIPERATYQIRVAAFDAWGMFDELKLSTQTSDIAQGIRDSDLAQEVRDAIAAPTVDKRWKTVASNGTSAAYVALDATNGNPSLLILGADQVAIGNGTANSFPFIIAQNGTTYIRSAMIQDGTITAAKIADAAITNAKIANLDVNKLIGNVAGFFWLNAVHIDANRIAGDKGHFIQANMRHASIVNAHIANLQVDRIKIANNSVTSRSFSMANNELQTTGSHWQTLINHGHGFGGGQSTYRVCGKFWADVHPDRNSPIHTYFEVRILVNNGQSRIWYWSSRQGSLDINELINTSGWGGWVVITLQWRRVSGYNPSKVGSRNIEVFESFGK